MKSQLGCTRSHLTVNPRVQKHKPSHFNFIKAKFLLFFIEGVLASLAPVRVTHVTGPLANAPKWEMKNGISIATHKIMRDEQSQGVYVDPDTLKPRIEAVGKN